MKKKGNQQKLIPTKYLVNLIWGRRGVGKRVNGKGSFLLSWRPLAQQNIRFLIPIPTSPLPEMSLQRQDDGRKNRFFTADVSPTSFFWPQSNVRFWRQHDVSFLTSERRRLLTSEGRQFSDVSFPTSLRSRFQVAFLLVGFLTSSWRRCNVKNRRQISDVALTSMQRHKFFVCLLGRNWVNPC